MEQTNKISVRKLALDVLQAVYDKQAYANIALNRAIGRTHLLPLDRKFLTELVYGTVKATGTLDYVLQKFVNRPLNKIPPMVLHTMRMGVYQILYMDKVPDSAACNEAVNLAKNYTHSGTVKFVNGVLRNIVRNKEQLEFPDFETNPAEHIALKYWHPLWLVRMWLETLGTEQTMALCQCNNMPARLSIRVNTLKTNATELLKILEAEGIQAQPSLYAQDGLVIQEMTKALAQSASFAKGLWQVQDESSMLVAQVMKPRPGSMVLDLCAAPGGKSTHIAQFMKNSGKVLAFDIYQHKLALIEENAAKLGTNIIDAQLHDAAVFMPELNNKADYVLVDAPCSGLGVLRRRADARWRKQAETLDEFPQLQAMILRNAAQYVKPGGTLIYSTCTIRAQENQMLIEEFLKKHPEFRRNEIEHPVNGQKLKELLMYPHLDGTDGFYIVSLSKSEPAES